MCFPLTQCLSLDYMFLPLYPQTLEPCSAESHIKVDLRIIYFASAGIIRGLGDPSTVTTFLVDFGAGLKRCLLDCHANLPDG